MSDDGRVLGLRVEGGTSARSTRGYLTIELSHAREILIKNLFCCARQR